MKKLINYRTFINLFFILFSLVFILPLILLVSSSFSSMDDIKTYGFMLIPKNITVLAYTYLFANIKDVLNAYAITIGYAVLGTTLSITVMAMIGYAISSDKFAFKKAVTYFLLGTMFFTGGIVPSYIINTQVYNLNDTFTIYVISSMVSAYTVFVFKAFFQQLPKSLFESARIDGASEWKILSSIVFALARPVLATYYIIGMLSRWNDYSVSLYYISSKSLYTLQFLLQNILTEAEQLRQLANNLPAGYDINNLPNESLKFAVCVVVTLPMLVVFPFFQKFFSKGMVVGSVKG